MFTMSSDSIARVLRLSGPSTMTDNVHALLVRLVKARHRDGVLTNERYSTIYREMLDEKPVPGRGIRLVLPSDYEGVGLARLASAWECNILVRESFRRLEYHPSVADRAMRAGEVSRALAAACAAHRTCEPRNEPLTTARGVLLVYDLLMESPEPLAPCRAWRLARMMELLKLDGTRLLRLLNAVGYQYLDLIIELGRRGCLSNNLLDRLTEEPRVLQCLSLETTERVLNAWTKSPTPTLDATIRANPLLIAPA